MDFPLATSPTVSQEHKNPTTYAMNSEKLKKSTDLAFVRRQRQFQAPLLSTYTIEKDSPRISKWHTSDALTASLISSDESRPPLLLAVMAFPNGIFRVVIDDFLPLKHTRHIVKDVLVPGAVSLPLQDRMLHVQHNVVELVVDQHAAKVKLTSEPFGLHLVTADDQQTLISFNQQSRLCVDDFTDAQGGALSHTEKFLTFTDSKPRGPESIGVDISFPSASHLHGIPERSSPFDLPNTLHSDGHIQSEPYRMYNLDIPYYEHNSPVGLYGAVPLLIARDQSNVTGVFWHNTSETYVDVIQTPPDQQSGKCSHWYSESGLLDTFLLPGPTPVHIFKQYLSLTGAPVMQQRFVLGYHQCRYSYVDESDVRFVDAGFDEHQIPYDVMWLDIDHTDGRRYFTWDNTLFPNPTVLRDDLNVKGRKMVTIVDPHVKLDDQYDLHKQATAVGNAYMRNADGTTFVGDCWPGKSSYLDFSSRAARQVWSAQFDPKSYTYFSPNTHIWNDMNEPAVFDGPERTFQKDMLHQDDVEHRHVHNIYGHDMISATHSAMQSAQGGDTRPFILTRSFFAGSQRYAAVWTGDNTADWDHLECSVRMVLVLQLCGIVMSGADVGGFSGNPDGELTTRWYQAAAFQPFFRGHSGSDTMRREPWLFGKPYTSFIAQAIRTRYEYIPYWYTLMAACAIGEGVGFEGVDIAPPMRPMWWDFPDMGGRQNETQWMVGDALMIAPVLKAGTESHIVHLPEYEVWYDLMDPKAPGRKIQSQGVMEVETDLGRMIVLQRGGTVIPKYVPGAKNTQCGAGEEGLTIVIAPDTNGNAKGKIYIDDGESFGYERGYFMLSEVRYERKIVTARKVDGTANGFGPSDGAMIGKVVLLGNGNVKSVVVNGNAVDFEYFEDGDTVTIDNLQLSIDGGWVMKIE